MAKVTSKANVRWVAIGVVTIVLGGVASAFVVGPLTNLIRGFIPSKAA